MDKTKKMTCLHWLAASLMLCLILPIQAQTVNRIEFCGKTLIEGTDSIALHIKLLDEMGNAMKNLLLDDIRKKLYLFENANDINDYEHRIKEDAISVRQVSKGGGERISEDFTFLVLVDRNIPDMQKVYDAVGELVKAAPKGCVYLAFYGDDVTASELVTTENFAQMRSKFDMSSNNNCFFSAMCAKLNEFNVSAEDNPGLKLQSGYMKNSDIALRASQHIGKNFLFVFADGSKEPDYESDQGVNASLLMDIQQNGPASTPKVFAFYYTGNGENEDMKTELQFAANPVVDGIEVRERWGKFFATTDMSAALAEFQQAVEDAAYDYDIIYKVGGQVYNGRAVQYLASWEGSEIGKCEMTIGTAENPFPAENLSVSDTVLKYLMALLVALLTFAFFFIVVKIVIPAIKSKSFEIKYFKPYVPKPGVNRIICRFCAQDILPGQKIVQRCNHLMHIHCWRQNGFHCTDYGQSCKTGIQPHVDWNMMFTRESMRDVSQTLTGIMAALVSWVVYELLGRGDVFAPLAQKIVGLAMDPTHELWNDCTNKVAAFLGIGLLLGFFLSLIFRYNDEYRQKDLTVWLKIVGLSLLSAWIGMFAFAVGGLIFTAWAGSLDNLVIPWYCSLPAYLLFSVCFSLSLCLGSSIPIKSALLGGLAAAVIGFIVLMFSGMSSSQSPWLNMLLNFIIYGGGLGASIATVRMMAERYFLVIQNGSRQGTEIPIHKWMNATGGGRVVTVGMIGDCEIQMNWENSNKVAKEHAQLYIEQTRKLPVIKPLTTGVVFNSRAELPPSREHTLNNGDTFQIGDTVFMYVERD
ncbi:MAG: FHA domain-containing protein [Muribaculaceae bacterium]|nr:FHA domain-containing protein [Muribaculaceae bacterium]